MRALFSKLFIPNQENEYAPHSLRAAAVLGMTALITLSFVAAGIQSMVWTSSEWMVSTILPSVIVVDTNEARAEVKQQPLVRSSVLDAAATMKAEHMAKEKYFAHFSPDGVTPWYWFEEAGYSFVYAGENLAVFFTDSSEIVDAWMKSPLHRENILNADFREIGIGVASGEFEGSETVFVVQLFGTPAASYVPPPLEAKADEEVTEVAETNAPIVAGVSEGEPSVSVTQEHDVVMYTDTISTSTGGLAAFTESETSNTSISEAAAYATQPGTILLALYVLIGGFVSVALALAVIIEIRRQQPLQIAYSTGLFVLMILLFEIHRGILGGALIL